VGYWHGLHETEHIAESQKIEFVSPPPARVNSAHNIIDDTFDRVPGE
jgi:hypothetical protein